MRPRRVRGKIVAYTKLTLQRGAIMRSGAFTALAQLAQLAIRGFSASYVVWSTVISTLAGMTA